MVDPIHDISGSSSAYLRPDQGQINYVKLVSAYRPGDVQQLSLAYSNFQQNPSAQGAKSALGQAIIKIIQDVAIFIFANPRLNVKDGVYACTQLLGDPNAQKEDICEAAAIACGLARIIQVPREGYSADSIKEASQVSDAAIGFLNGLNTTEDLYRSLECLKMTL